MKKDIFDSLLEIKNAKKDVFDRLLEISNKNDYEQDYAKFVNDPVSFIGEHGKIIHPVKGVIPFKLYKHQKELIHSYHENRFNIVHSARQTGLTAITAMYAFHHAFFTNNKTVIIVSNKQLNATNILDRMRITWNSLPEFHKSANRLIVNNKNEMSFINGSKILALSSRSGAIRGVSANLVIMDNFAHLPRSHQEDFFMSVLPLVQYTNGKLIITSTAASTNTLFKDIWDDAVKGINGFIAHHIAWNVIPGRDNKFKEETISVIGKQQWKVEYECPTMIKDNHNGTRSKSKFKET